MTNKVSDYISWKLVVELGAKDKDLWAMISDSEIQAFVHEEFIMVNELNMNDPSKCYGAERKLMGFWKVKPEAFRRNIISNAHNENYRQGNDLFLDIVSELEISDSFTDFVPFIHILTCREEQLLKISSQKHIYFLKKDLELLPGLKSTDQKGNDIKKEPRSDKLKNDVQFDQDLIVVMGLLKKDGADEELYTSEGLLHAKRVVQAFQKYNLSDGDDDETGIPKKGQSPSTIRRKVEARNAIISDYFKNEAKMK